MGEVESIIRETRPGLFGIGEPLIEIVRTVCEDEKAMTEYAEQEKKAREEIENRFLREKMQYEILIQQLRQNIIDTERSEAEILARWRATDKELQELKDQVINCKKCNRDYPC